MSTKFIQKFAQWNDLQQPVIVSTESISSSPIKSIAHIGTILLQSGQVLEWDPDNRQLNEFQPLKGKVVSKMLANESGVMFITDAGELYLTGSNGYEKFGMAPDTDDRKVDTIREIRQGSWTPQLRSERITHATCCYNSSIIITDEMNIYFLGQCFREQMLSSSTPFRLPMNEEYRIETVSGGYFHASILLSSGDVWVTGERDSLHKVGVTWPGAGIFHNLAQCTNLDEKFVFAQSAVNYSIFATESKAIYVSGNPPHRLPGSIISLSLFKLNFQPRAKVVSVTIPYGFGSMYVGTLDGLYSRQLLGKNSDDCSAVWDLTELNYTPEQTSEYTAVSHFGKKHEVFYIPLQSLSLVKRHFMKPFRAFHDMDIFSAGIDTPA